MKKGTQGYIKQKKIFQLCLSIILFAIAISIFVVGYYLNQEEKNNIFAIIAILMVLPASKSLVSFIVVAPYKSVGKETYNEIASHITTEMELLTDLVITSTEKVMNLDFLIITGDNVIGIIGKQRQDVIYIENYINRGIKNSGKSHHVKIFKDYKAFKNRINSLEHKAELSISTKEIKAYLLSLAI